MDFSAAARARALKAPLARCVSKVVFLENEGSHGKMVFYIFYSVLSPESIYVHLNHESSFNLCRKSLFWALLLPH